MHALKRMTEESSDLEPSSAVGKKGRRHLISIEWVLKMQKSAVLSTFRVYDSVVKKNIKPEIAVVRAGNNSRPKGRFMLMQGQGESEFSLVALPEIDRLADTGAGGTQG